MAFLKLKARGEQPAPATPTATTPSDGPAESPFALEPHRALGARIWRVLQRTVIVLLCISGFFQMVVNPIRRATADPAPASTEQAIDPAAASQLAVAFTGDYLSFDPKSPAVRQAALTRWTGPGVDLGKWAGNTQLSTDVITAGPVLTVDDTHVVVQTTARVTPAAPQDRAAVTDTDTLPGSFAADPGPSAGSLGARWLTLDVTVGVGDLGLGVLGTVFTGDAPAYLPPAPNSDATATNLTRELPDTIFDALATGDLQYLTVPGITLRGLGGAFALDHVTNWAVASSTDPTDRQATATVTWQLADTDLVIDQRYALHLTETDDRWFVDAAATALES